MFLKWFNWNIFKINWSKFFQNNLLNQNIFEMNQSKYFQNELIVIFSKLFNRNVFKLNQSKYILNDLIEILGNESIKIISNIEIKTI